MTSRTAESESEEGDKEEDEERSPFSNGSDDSVSEYKIDPRERDDDDNDDAEDFDD